MKKNVILVIMLLSAMGLSAQMYVGLGFGYHMPSNSGVLGTKTSATGDDSNIYGTNGKGILPELRFGYMLNDNWGLEFGVSYLMGSEQLVNENLNPGIYDSYKSESFSKTTMIRFAPQLVFKTEGGIYSRFGLYLPLTGKTIGTQDVVVGFMGTTSTTHVEVEYVGSFAIGFTGSFGYTYALNDQMSLFGELQFIGLSIKRKSSEIVAYTVDGADKLATLKTIQKQTEYVDQVLVTDNQNVDQSLKSLSSVSPYHSFGINIGLYYKL